MIISYSRNFCFIRVPKNASTSVSMAMVESGILCPERDYCSPSIEFDQRSMSYHPNVSINTSIKSVLDNYDRTHHSVTQYHELGLLDDSMEIISTIRHPIERFESFVKFLYTDPNPNVAWDHLKECVSKNRLDKSFLLFDTQNLYNRMTKPQHWWFGNDATLWAVEHVDKKLSAFLSVPCHSCERKSTRQLSEPLTQDRKNEILSHYERDFVFWEQTIC